MRSLLLTGVSLLAALTAPFATSSAQPYEIQFHRAYELNDQFEYTAEAHSKMSVDLTAGGNPLQQEKQDLKGSMSSTLTVLEVNEEGTPTKEEHLIKTFAGEMDGKPLEEIPAGSLVVATLNSDSGASFTLDGAPVDGPTAQLFDNLITLSSKSTNADDFLSADAPKSVGDEWEVGAEGMLEEMKKSGMTVDADSIDGKATLVGEVDSPVGKALEIRADIKVDLASNPVGIPMDFEEAGMTATMTGLLPIDPEMHSPRKEITMKVSLKGEGEPQPGTKVGLTMTIDQGATITLTPLP